MKDRKLATRYAKALLGALPDAAAQNLADEFLAALGASLKSNAELRAFLLDPATPAGAKKSLLDQLATARQVPDRVKTFVSMVVDNGRLAALPSIAEVFHQERERAQGIVSGTLTTAAPIGDDLASRAADALTRLSGRRVQLRLRLDPEILGGAVAQVGSMVYDGSVRTQLDRLRQRIAKE